MELGTYIEALAQRIDNAKASIGLEGVSYPPENYVPASPWLMLRQSMYVPGSISKARAGLQVVQPSIDLVFLVTTDGKSPGDASRLDKLVHPVLDLFDANANGGNVNYAFTGILTENVDRVWNDAPIRRATIPWGETPICHALIITLDSEFQRRAELP